MSTYRLGQRVKILTSEKTDGRFNCGKIVGIVMTQNGFYLGYMNEKEFLARFTIPEYVVAYIDCVTERACTDRFTHSQLERYTK